MMSIEQAQDELAALLSRNLTFDPAMQAIAPQEATPNDQSQPIEYSASQHYNHSAHITQHTDSAGQEEPLRSASVPPQGESAQAEHMLRIHGIDTQSLTPSQIQLFRVADAPQQRRLLELWSICPPKNGGDIPALAWSSTSVEQEEQLARLRYESLQQEASQQEMAVQNTTVQTSEGQWHQHQESEPYMTSGYEELMRREQERNAREAHSCYSQAIYGPTYSHAMDPVYQGPDFIREQQQMEMAAQYGTFQQMYGPGESMDVM